MELKQFPSAEEQNKRIAELEAENQRLREAAQEAVDEYYNTPSEPDYYLASMQKLEAALKQEGG